MVKKLIIISGPSGVGKNAVARGLLEKRDGLERVITCTTRQPRPQEVDGRDYIFLSEDEFKNKVAQGEFLEQAKVHDHYYGILYSEIDKVLAMDKNPLLVIDVQGGLHIKEKVPANERLMIFLVAESELELRERIRKRKGKMSSEALEIRMKNADKEMAMVGEYDYRVVNREGKLDETVNEVLRIIDK